MNKWSLYWLIWFTASFATFIVPELWAIISRHTENTLSAQVWALEDAVAGQSPLSWTAVHWLLGGLFFVIFIWLIGHFVFRIWA